MKKRMTDAETKEENHGWTADEAEVGRWRWQREQREEDAISEEGSESDVLEFVKCRECGWIHILVNENGLEECFGCYGDRHNMAPSSKEECPIGATIQGLQR